MRHVWIGAAALFVAQAAAVGFAPAARADDPPETVEASRVTYYVDLGEAGGEAAQALVALLRREFPGAQVDLLEGTLRVQTDASTLPTLQKVLEAQRARTLGAGDGERKERERQERARKEQGEKPRDGDKPEKVRKERADKPGDDERQALEALRRMEQELAKGRGEEHEGLETEETVVVIDGGDGPRIVRDDGTVLLAGPDGKEARIVLKGGRGAPPVPSIAELEKRLVEARQAGRERAVVELERALEIARKERAAALKRAEAPSRPDVRRFLVDPEGLEALRERAARLRERLGDKDGDLDGVRRRVIELRERLAKLEGLPRGGEHEGQAVRPELKVRPARPPERVEPSKAGGPMAEWRERLSHLKQAAEHLMAAGYEGLAKQVREAAEKAAAQAEEVARKLRAQQEAREAEMKEREAAEQRARAERGAAERERRAREPGEARGDELLDLVRGLKREVETLRKELHELRERVGAK